MVAECRNPSNYANGNTRDRQGRLVTCEHGTRRVTRTEHDGSLTVLLDRYDGKQLNAPNDVVVHPDGGIWFTDPGYGSLGHYEGHKVRIAWVYRIDPHSASVGRISEVGLAFSPTSTLVSDTGARTTGIPAKSTSGQSLSAGSVLD